MVMTTCISKQFQIYATRRPHVDDHKFLLSNKFTSIRMLNNNTCFRSCSVSSSSFDRRQSILLVHSCSRLYPICNLFDDIRNNLSRMLASSVLLLPVIMTTLALLCIQVPASAAASYGRMGGGSSGGGSSDSLSNHYYNDYSSSCNCKTPIKNTNENRPRKKRLLYVIAEPLVFILFCISAVIYVIIEDDKIANNGELGQFMWGTVIMIQVGILDKKRVLQRKLNRIGGTADTEYKSGLHSLLKEVVISLLEHHDHCHFAYLYEKYDHLEESSRPRFRGLLETEVAKFDKNDETFANVDGVKYRKESAGKVNNIDNEYSVVTLLVLVDGKVLIPSMKRNSKCVNKGDVKTALETIFSIPRRAIEGVEVLWTPQMEKDVVSKQDVRRDFCYLMRPVDLTN